MSSIPTNSLNNPFPTGYVTPNKQFSLGGVPSPIAQALAAIDTALVATASTNQLGIVTGFDFSYTPPSPNLYDIAIVIQGTAAMPAAFAQSALEVDLSYNDTAGPQLAPAILTALTNGSPEAVVFPVFAVPGAPINVFTSFTTYGVPGTLPANPWNVQATRGGVGTAAYGAILHQAVTNSTAFFYGYITNANFSGYMFYNRLTGADDFTHLWTDPVSGQTFLPVQSSQGQGTFSGPGTNAIQFVTGAFGAELNVPTTTWYLGPHISGTPDQPSNIVRIPGPTPNATAAWYDATGGGIFVPSSAPILQVFSYNLHVRVSTV